MGCNDAFFGQMLRKYMDCMMHNQTEQSLGAKPTCFYGQLNVPQSSTRHVTFANITCRVVFRAMRCRQRQHFKAEIFVKYFASLTLAWTRFTSSAQDGQ